MQCRLYSNSKHGLKFKTLPIKEQNSENQSLGLTDYSTLQSPTLPDFSTAITDITKPQIPQFINTQHVSIKFKSNDEYSA